MPNSAHDIPISYTYLIIAPIYPSINNILDYWILIHINNVYKYNISIEFHIHK